MLTLTLALLPFVAADDGITIADLAPKDSIVLVTVNDWPAMRKAADSAALGDLWRDPAMQEFIHEFMKEEFADEGGPAAITKWLEDLKISRDDLSEPTGAVGLAGFLSEPTDAEKASADEGDAEPRQTAHILAMAEFGEQAEKMEQTLIRALKEIEIDGGIEIEEDAYKDITITHVIPVKPADEDNEGGSDAAAGETEPDWEYDESNPVDSALNFDEINDLRFARVNGALILCSSEEHLEMAIDRIVGGPTGVESISDDKDYRDAVGQHPTESHLFGVVLFNDTFREVFAPTAELLPGLTPSLILDMVGIRAVRSASFGAEFDTDQGILEQTLAVAVPEKKGVLGLFGGNPDRGFTPPSSVGADATQLTLINFQFNKLIETIQEAIKAMPEDEQGQAAGALAMTEMTVGPMLSQMGPDVFIAVRNERPLGVESARTTVSIRSGDLAATQTVISQMAPQIGLAPRDFQGNQIFDNADMPEMGIGLGFGHIFAGAARDVEDAMRLASNDTAPKLADDDAFKRATAVLRPGGIFYSLNDLRETIEVAYWQLQNADKIFDAQIADFDEATRDMLSEDRPKQAAWVSKLPPLELWTKHLGDSISEFHPTAEGYFGRTILLRPSNSDE